MAEIFDGNKYSSGWKKSNGCSGHARHYPTRFDGNKKFYCVSEGDCSGGDVIRCAWNGGHNWLFNDATSNGALVAEFLLLWAKPSHIGKGQVVGQEVIRGNVLNTTILIDSEEDLTHEFNASSLAQEKTSPYTPGHVTVAKATYAGVEWTYRVNVPKSYSSSTPMPLIIQHPGWGMNAKSEESGCGIGLYTESYGFISVTAQGGNDNTNNGGPWYSWNAVGSTQSPGPGGPTCTSAANYPSYCYSSCSPCTSNPQCSWTTCHETITPTGTGTKDVGGFIPGLYP